MGEGKGALIRRLQRGGGGGGGEGARLIFWPWGWTVIRAWALIRRNTVMERF